MQEKETCLETRSLGSILIFSGEAYKKHYGRDAVQDDGLQAEDWKSPTGTTLRVFKASMCRFSLGWERFFFPHTALKSNLFIAISES